MSYPHPTRASRRSSRVLATNRSRNSSYSDSCTSTRSADVQSCPAAPKDVRTAASAALSTSAPARTTSGFFPPSSSETPTSRSPAWRGDDAAGRGGAGERDVVGAGDHSTTDRRPVAEHDLPCLRREPRLDRELACAQSGQCSLVVGLVHDAVAGDEGRQRVDDREGERVVPGRHDADDALGVVQLAYGEDARRDRHATLGPQNARCHAGAVARGERDLADLLEGVEPRLATLDLDQVHQLVAVVEDEVVEPEQNLRAGAGAERQPGRLGCAGPCVRLPHIVLARPRDLGQRLLGERRDGLDRVSAGRDDRAGQPLDLGWVDGRVGGWGCHGGRIRPGPHSRDREDFSARFREQSLRDHGELSGRPRPRPAGSP